MRSDAHATMRFLLDEHYPGWLAESLRHEGLDVVALIADCPDLHGVDDETVLRAAVADRRVVVTEDVTTFGAAATLVPDHVGIVYCHHARFPRTRAGLHILQTALLRLAEDPPPGLGEQPVVWWLAVPPADSAG